MNVETGPLIIIRPSKIQIEERSRLGSQCRGMEISHLVDRERAERAAAKRATSANARRAHQEMAQAYADALQRLRSGHTVAIADAVQAAE